MASFDEEMDKYGLNDPEYDILSFSRSQNNRKKK